MNSTQLQFNSQPATEAFARAVGDCFAPGDALLLSGGLGAGKSTFARALLRHLADDPAMDVPSPSFSLVQSYPPRIGPVHHFDLWRLEGDSELAELGWDESLADGVIVEWPERLGARLLADLPPAICLRLDLAATGEHSRRITLSGWPDRLPRLLSACPSFASEPLE